MIVDITITNMIDLTVTKTNDCVLLRYGDNFRGLVERPGWLIRSGSGSALRGRTTEFESRLGRMFVIGVCAYTVLQTVKIHRVCNAVYGTVHNKKNLNLFDFR